MKKEATKKEQIQGIIIAILTAIVIFGGAYFASELKYCEVAPIKEVKLDEIGMIEFTTLLNDSEPSIVYIARPGCGFCQQQEPIVKEIVSETGTVVHYLNTDNLTNEEMLSLFSVDVELFGKDGKEFGTPTMLIVKSGKIVDSKVGLTEKQSLIDFFKKYDLIK